MNNLEPEVINGGHYRDERGQLDFFNNFIMASIKRVYFTTHFNTEVVRAWQGHKIENRWFLCVKGRFNVNIVQIDNWENPSDNCKIFNFILEENNPQVLFIPKGFVNGFKAIEENSKLMIMSDYELNEIEDDQVRFDSEKWVNWKK